MCIVDLVLCVYSVLWAKKVVFDTFSVRIFPVTDPSYVWRLNYEKPTIKNKNISTPVVWFSYSRSFVFLSTNLENFLAGKMIQSQIKQESRSRAPSLFHMH